MTRKAKDTWRERFAPDIAEVIAEFDRENQSLDAGDRIKQLRRLLVCPLGFRGYWPGKVWRDEVGRQLGTKAARLEKRKHEKDVAAGQAELF